MSIRKFAVNEILPSVIQPLADSSMSAIILTVTLSASLLPFPLYKQCDILWGDDLMGIDAPEEGHRATICQEGCAMSCVAMVLAGAGFALPSATDPATPGSLNAYLIDNGGYHCDAGDCDNLVLDAPDRLTNGKMRLIGEWAMDALSPSSISSALEADDIAYLAHVHNPKTGHVTHFVLLLSYDTETDTFRVNDPGYASTAYARVNVSDILMYELLPAAATVPAAYPLFKQCDPAWGSDVIHVKTVCQVGCLMSSTAMALRQRHILIPPANASAPVNATPGTLNSWLLANGGYVGDTDNLDEEVVVQLDPSRIAWNDTTSMHRTNDLPWATVVDLLDSGAAVIANVMSGEHFVLCVGYDRGAGGDTLYVNDPGFNRPAYSYASDVVGWRLYAIAPDGKRTEFEAQRAALSKALPMAHGIVSK